MIGMAKNTGLGYRVGAVNGRSQFSTPSGLPAKRDDKTGRIMDVKSDTKPFKRAAREVTLHICVCQGRWRTPTAQMVG
jgi:hypothetical protein